MIMGRKRFIIVMTIAMKNFLPSSGENPHRYGGSYDLYANKLRCDSLSGYCSLLSVGYN